MQGQQRAGQPYHSNEKVTSLPFAEVRFYEWDGETEPEQLISKMENQGDISWILSVSSNIATNPAKAEQTAEYMHSRQRRSFIGYLYEDGGRCLNGSGDGSLNGSGDGRLNEAGDGCLNEAGDGYPNEDGDGYLNVAGDGSNLTKSSVPYEEIELFPFCVSSAGGLEEKNYQKGINRKALLLHKYYMREWHEHARKEEIWKAFRADPYNIHSSLCSVLSIPYQTRLIGH